MRHEEHFYNKTRRLRRPFVAHGAKPQYAPDLPVKVEHLRIDVLVDPEHKTLRGKVTFKVRLVEKGLHEMCLDQVGLKIDRVRVGKDDVPFRMGDDKLYVTLPDVVKKAEPGSLFDFSVRYHCKDPRRGLYFTGPDKDYPKKPVQVWTQCQDEDMRYWVPSFDFPNQKATVEVIATVPKGMHAIANGKLANQEDKDDWTRFHYQLSSPIVTYLVTLVVGKFAQWSDKGPGGLPVEYFVDPPRLEDGKRSFSRTPRMIEVFEKKIGVPFPYEKYAQVAVQDFIFGGMENASATTQTDLTLHDERAHLDFSSDPLVSHELAHQWFGDLVTCRDWSHGWLNEGFATFFERVWIENDDSPNGGWNEAKYHTYQDLQAYFAEDRESYRRPIVSNFYIDPIDLFDRHLYQKGGLFVNYVRHILGEENFWKSVQFYVNRNKNENVETLDLIRAIEDASGRNLRRYFEQWVYCGGFPELEAKYSYKASGSKGGIVEIEVEQKQTDGKEELIENGVKTPVFHLPCVLAFNFEDGSKEAHCVEINELRNRYYFQVKSEPTLVRMDPDAWIPKTLKFPRPRNILLNQLLKDPDIMGQIEAVDELKGDLDRDVFKAFEKVLLDSKTFWGVKKKIASFLGKNRSKTAEKILLKAADERHPKARRAVVNALGDFHSDTVCEKLQSIASGDDSYYVEADATKAYIKAFFPATLSTADKKQRGDSAELFLRSQAEKDSYLELIRRGAFESVPLIPGVFEGRRNNSIDLLVEWSRRGRPETARRGAIVSLGRVLRMGSDLVRDRILGVFKELSAEDDFMIRHFLVQALSGSEQAGAIPILQHIRENDLDGRVKRNAADGIEAIRETLKKPEVFSSIKTDLEKMREEQEKLKAELERISSSVGPKDAPELGAPKHTSTGFTRDYPDHTFATGTSAAVPPSSVSKAIQKPPGADEVPISIAPDGTETPESTTSTQQTVSSSVFEETRMEQLDLAKEKDPSEEDTLSEQLEVKAEETDAPELEEKGFTPPPKPDGESDDGKDGS